MGQNQTITVDVDLDNLNNTTTVTDALVTQETFDVSMGLSGPEGPPGISGLGYFNVLDYGATGGGVIDDTSAVQATINAAQAAGGGIVFFPSGQYLISLALTGYTGVSYLGEGSEASEVVQSSTTAGFLVGTDVASISIEGLLITGPGSGTANGIDLGWSTAGNLPFLDFRDLWVRDFGGSGISLETPIVSVFERVIVQNNGAYGFDLYHAGTSCTFISCWARENVQAGYHFYETIYSGLHSCAADDNGIGYLVENAQDVDFYSCGAESQLVGAGDWDGTGFKISNSSCCGIYGGYVGQNPAIGIWVTNGSIATEIFAVADNSPTGTATAFVKTDVSTNVTLSDVHNTTANSYSAGTVTVLNDGANGMLTKQLTVKDSSGSMILTAASDGGEYNIEADTTGTLAVYGSGGQTLGVHLLDGLLTLDAGMKLTSGAPGSGKILTSDGSGNGTWQTATGLTNPMTTLGDIIYENATPAAARLAGITSATMAVLTQTGTGSVSAAPAWTSTTGTGNIVRASSPTLVTPALGTPSALVLTNATGTPTSIGLANGSGLPISTGVSGLGTGVATFLATPSSANLASAVTDETGSGALVFANTPTLVTPVLGVATATSLNGLTVSTTTGTLTLVNGSSLITAGAFALTLTTTATSNVTFPTGSSTMVAVNATQTLTAKTITGLKLTAGTTTVAPLTIASGTNLTSAVSGSIEFDGSALTYTDSTPTRQTLVTTGKTATLSNKTITGLILTAGTTTVAPLTFSAVGALLTTAVANSVEWDGTNLYYTTSGPTRHTIVSLDQTQTLTNKTLTSPVLTSPTSNTLLTANTQISLVGASGTLAFTAASDGGDYNIFSANGNQTLAIYGSGGNTLNLHLLDGLASFDAGTNTAAGAAVTSPTFVSGTAQQINTTKDAMLYIDVKTAASLSIAIGPTSTPANTLQSSVVGGLGLESIRVPAGWYVSLTGTMADLTITAITC